MLIIRSCIYYNLQSLRHRHDSFRNYKSHNMEYDIQGSYNRGREPTLNVIFRQIPKCYFIIKLYYIILIINK